MKDFWLSCGHHLLDRDAGGGLVVTDEFLKVYLARPELAPPPEACVVEKTLHAALMSDPRRSVSADEIAAIADADARENWQVMIAFRDRLLRHRTLEAAYLDIIRTGAKVPHIFLNQLVHVILRNALDGCDDPFVLRAGELFFRTQRMTLHEGSLIAADEETIAGTSNTPTSPLVSMLGIPAEAEIDIMSEENAEHYFEHSDLFHVALDLTGGRRGLRSARRGDAALDRACDERRGRDRAAHRAARREIHLVCRARRRRQQDRRSAVERRGARRGSDRERGRAVPPHLPRSGDS